MVHVTNHKEALSTRHKTDASARGSLQKELTECTNLLTAATS